MRASETRAGNYFINDKGKEEIVCEMKSHTKKGMLNGVWLKFRPIKLTEEWLLKFGVYFGFNAYNNQYEIEYAIEEYHLRLNYDVGMSKFIGVIKYVHQLQNLYFALTNTELTIKES